MNVDSFSVKLIASSAPAPTMWRGRGSMQRVGDDEQQAQRDQPGERVLAPGAGDREDRGADREQQRGERCTETAEQPPWHAIRRSRAMPASAATSRAHPGVVPKWSSTKPSR